MADGRIRRRTSPAFYSLIDLVRHAVLGGVQRLGEFQNHALLDGFEPHRRGGDHLLAGRVQEFVPVPANGSDSQDGNPSGPNTNIFYCLGFQVLRGPGDPPVGSLAARIHQPPARSKPALRCRRSPTRCEAAPVQVAVPRRALFQMQLPDAASSPRPSIVL